MAIASGSGFIGGTNAAPEIAKLPMGATSRAGNGFLTAATGQTLSADSPEVIRIVNPSTAINQDLPTTGVKAGRRFMLVVSGATEANYVALRSSGGNEIDRIGGQGFIMVQALQDTPTTAAHWEVLGVEEKTALLSLSASGANTNTVSAYLRRKGRICSGSFLQTPAAALGGGGITFSVPARFYPSEDQLVCSTGTNNGVYLVGLFIVNSSGSIVFSSHPSGSFSGNCGIGSSGDYSHLSWSK